MSSDANTPLPDFSIEQWLLETNQKLEMTTLERANHAFNLGCLIGILPAALFVVITVMVTGGSWVGGIFSTILMLIAITGLASMIAKITRSNTTKRIFETEIKTEMLEISKAHNLSLDDFSKNIYVLPESALLRLMIMEHGN